MKDCNIKKLQIKLVTTHKTRLHLYAHMIVAPLPAEDVFIFYFIYLIDVSTFLAGFKDSYNSNWYILFIP